MPRKSKRNTLLKSQDESKPEVEATGLVSEVQANKSVSSQSKAIKKKKKKTKKPVDPNMSELEKRRRDMQNQIRETVVSMRKEGYTKEDIDNAVYKLKKNEQRAVLKIANRLAREEKGAKHDVIVIPISWKREMDDKKSVDAMASEIRRRLLRHGVNVWVDSRREYTPGQKFAYWEHLGVPLRVEIGPDDLKAHECKLVKAENAGAYQEHVRKAVGLNSRAIMRQLVTFGFSKSSLEEEGSWSEDEFLGEEEGEKEEREEDEELAGNANLSSPPQKKKKY